MRFTFTEDDIDKVCQVLIIAKKDGCDIPLDDKEIDKLLETISIQKEQNRIRSQKMRDKTKKASETKRKNTMNKIQNAVNLMIFEGRDVTIRAVSEVSGVSYKTVEKYKRLLLHIDSDSNGVVALFPNSKV